MNPVVVVVVTVVTILLSAFFVVIEFALLGARRHRLQEQAPTHRSARAALRGMNELTLMLAGAQLGITACTFVLGAVTKPAFDGWLGPTFRSWGAPEWLAGGSSFLVSLLLVTFLHLVIGEMAPKSWAIAHPEPAARAIGLPSRGFIWLFRPFLIWVNNLANKLVARSGIKPVDRAAIGGRDADTIRHLVDHSAQIGVLEEHLHSHLSEAIDLQFLTVGDITRPNPDPTAVPAGASVADVRSAARATGHLRILIPEGAGHGVVHVRDTLLAAPEEAAASFARPAFRVDATLPAHELLARMRARSVQFALVDREGTLFGVITLTDVIRRILPVAEAGTV